MRKLSLVLLALGIACDLPAPDRLPASPAPAPPREPEPAFDLIDEVELLEEQARVCSSIETRDDDPRVLLVVDRSGSMGENMAGSSDQKWNVLRNALSSMTEALADTFEHGLMLFPSRGGDVCDSGDTVLGMGLNNAAQIQTQLSITVPDGGTPTRGTLETARDVAAPLASNGQPLVVVLATDGLPNCVESNTDPTCTCTDPDAAPGQCPPLNCVDDAGTFGALAELREMGVKTFVVGVSITDAVAPTIAQMARFGGTARATGTNWFDAPDEGALLASLEDVAERTLACRLVTDNVGGFGDVDALELVAGDVALPRDVERLDGWDLVSDNAIELFGPTCDRAADEIVRVSSCR